MKTMGGAVTTVMSASMFCQIQSVIANFSNI